MMKTILKNMTQKTGAVSGSVCCSLLLCCAALFSLPAQAKPTTSGETYTPNARAFQQVCHGKAEGTPVSLALNGVIFNGTCQVMLVPGNPKATAGVEDSALAQACVGKKAGESIAAPLNGQDVKGKCALSFHTIEPTTAQ